MQVEPPRAPGGGGSDSAGTLRRRRRSLAIVGVVLLFGLAASLAGGLWWRANVRSERRHAFQATAADVTATLGTMLRRDADFVSTLRATLTMQPRIGASEFHQWYSQLDGRQRQVGGLGTTVVVRVPAHALRRFQARRDADRQFRAFLGSRPEPVVAAGGACLLSAGVSVTGSLGSALAHDLQGNWCDPSSGIGISEASLLQTQTDSEQLLVEPVTAQGRETVFFQASFYRRGARLTSVARRRAAVLGWVSSSFDIPKLIRSAMSDHSGLGVALFHVNPDAPAELVARVGRIADPVALTRHRSLQIDGNWAITVSQPPAVAGGLSPELQGLLVALVGFGVTFLLFLLTLVLARSREHALGMVRQKAGELSHLALHDVLTGLPNRVLTLDRAGQMLVRAQRARSPIAALYVDLDGFKGVNDSFGHAAGDELLLAVADRLKKVIRDGDTVACFGGDEFVVLLEASSFDAGPELIAERLLEVLRAPYELDGMHGRRLSLSASVGVALASSGTADELLRSADLALYRAKRDGRDRSVLFESSMQSAASDRLILEMDLCDALANDELFLEYQPTFDLRSEEIAGLEALIRWRHPTRGVISPGEFVSIAEQSGRIIPIGRWVLEQACRQAARWARDGHEIGVAVNVSARQLDADELIDDVAGALADSGLAPGSLTLEITETALMRDADEGVLRLTHLKQLGVRIAIDDFGTGYSSLAYLRRFPADALKIDRSFVASVATSRESAALVDTLVQLGRSLHIQTLAEGIEDREQLTALQHADCDLGQGFLFSRPLPVAAVDDLLADRGPTRAAFTY